MPAVVLGTDESGRQKSADTGLLTSFPTDPLESTSVAIQDSDALKPGTGQGRLYPNEVKPAVSRSDLELLGSTVNPQVPMAHALLFLKRPTEIWKREPPDASTAAA
jgi:hypothetical protein